MGKKITGAVVDAAAQSFYLTDLELELPRSDEVLIEVAGTGICHTDLVAQGGHFALSFPAVFGHEGAGIVREIGSGVTKVKVGDRVAMSFMSCGQCTCCARNQPAYCISMSALNSAGTRGDGSKTLRIGTTSVSGNFFNQSSFASHALASERNIVVVPDEVPLDVVGILGCGVQTGAGAVLRSLDCKPGSSLLITGAGAVGLAAVMGAKLRGLGTVIVAEVHENRRKLALELGANYAINPIETPLAAAVRDILPDGVDAMLDTTGLPQVVKDVPEVLARMGQFGFVGIPPGDQLTMPLPGSMMGAMRNGWTFRGIIEGDSDVDNFLKELMEEYLAGRFPFDRMVTRYPLAEINKALEDQNNGLCIKPVLIP